jgi:hypothetical protein
MLGRVGRGEGSELHAPHADRKPQDLVELREVACLDHTVRLVEHEKAQPLYLCRQLCILQRASATAIYASAPRTLIGKMVLDKVPEKGPGNVQHGEIHTSSSRSHRRPGVATRTSTPRPSTRRCFCALMPPTIAATLTSGGALFVAGAAAAVGLALALPLAFALPLPLPLPGAAGVSLPDGAPSSASASGAAVGSDKHALRCDDTCSASSRVGARTSACSARRPFGGRPAAAVSRCESIGRPYASVLPEP